MKTQSLSPSNLRTIYTLLLLLLTVSLAQKNCKYVGTDSDGSFTIDLSTMKEPFVETDGKSGDYKHRIAFCRSLDTVCKDKGREFKAIYYTKYQILGAGSCFYMGATIGIDDSTVKLIDDASPKDGVILTYEQGEKVMPLDKQEGITCKTYVRALCKPDLEQSIITYDGTEDTEDTRWLRFTVETPAACPTRESAVGSSFWGWGIGATVLTVAAVGFAGYVLIGVLVNVFKFKKRGLEVLPQVHLWKEVPLLVKDGFMLIVDCCLAVVKRRKGYSEV